MQSDLSKAEGSARQFPRRGLWLGLILTLLTGGLLLTAHYALHQDTSLAQPKAEQIIHEQKLASGTICRVAIYALPSSSGRAEKLEQLEVSISGQPDYVPAEAFSDLRNVAVRDGVELAEFAADTFLLFAGGENKRDWQAKFTIRNFHVVERELTFAGQAPILAQYAPPLEVHNFPLPLEEVEKVRKQENQKINERNGVKP